MWTPKLSRFFFFIPVLFEIKLNFVPLSILFPSEPIKSSHGKVKLQQRDDLSKKKKMNLEKNGEKSSKKMYRTKGFNHFFSK